MKTLLIFCMLAPVCFSLHAQNKPVPLRPIDEQRVASIIPLLPEEPAGFGDPITHRKTWDRLLKSGKYDGFLKEMKTFTFPAFSKEDYFSLSDGSASSSGRGLTMMRNRAKGLSQITWAECLENKGNYTKAVEAGLRDILEQKSWVSPRNDFDFKNYNGKGYSVELTSALYAHTIAQTLYMMGEKLNPQLRKDAIAALYKRVFNPVLEKIKTQNKERENKFLEMTNNYNHVCLSGVVGAALTILEDKKERATFAYIGEYYSQNGLVGFGDDGYCSEGVGYFNYGFGHYVLLRENLWQATGGKLDLFSIPKVKKIANYVPNLEIIHGVFPAISDSHPGAKADSSIMNYLSRNLGLGLRAYDGLTFEGETADNRNDVMMVFPNSASKAEPRMIKRSEESLLRSFFDQTGVLVSRPLPGTPCDMGIAFKGGNNKENHNHNDVGSYTVVLGNEIMVGDPGSIPYTSNIFDEKYRYTYKAIASYGHPVPLVADKQQRPGAQAKAIIVKQAFSKDEDVLVLDLASAYDVPELTRLERKMLFNRTKKGQITLTDDFAYTSPQAFETAIITRSGWKKINDNTLELKKGKKSMRVSLSSPGNKLIIRSEEIVEGGVPFVRIGVATEKPVKAGQIIVTYLPIP